MPKKITIISFGKIKDKNLKIFTDIFIKRIKPFFNLDMIRLKDGSIEKNSEKILKYRSENTYVLDAKGDNLDSTEFAYFIKGSSNNLTFIIGDAEGFTNKTRSQFNLISLSKMTFPHDIAKLLLIEQIYRSAMILNNRQYDK